MTLPRLRGHEEARAHLARAGVSGTLPQSVLLHGPSGVGKERFGLWLAQLLVCERPSSDGPCGECHSCRLAARVEHPDVHWFFPLPRPESASDRIRDKLEDHRAKELQLRRDRPAHVPTYERAPAYFVATIQTIQQMAAVRPAMGRRKVFVVGDAELMVPQEATQEAANAFLKLLEEPSADTTVIVTSSRPGALLPTIRSRVLPIRLRPLEEDDVFGFLLEEVHLAADDARRVARASQGAIGRALRLIPGEGGAGSTERFGDKGRALLLAALAANDTPRFAAAHAQAPAGGRGDFTAELLALGEWLRDLLAVASGAEDRLSDPEALPTLRRAVDEYGIHPLAVGTALDDLAAAVELA
ncbi:MAG: hypothetical protein KY464_05155, partial [Gemmatimonadetes bacterium]|nr:hypothetical protein [Gemmatimonadota bacterium]